MAEQTGSLASMTGFARREGGDGRASWTWEVKSVNGRSLDVRCRLPGGYDALEAIARNAALERFSRGNLQLTLMVDRGTVPAALQINRELLESLLALLRELESEVEAAPPRLDSLLAFRGVVETVEARETPDELEARFAAIAADLTAALDALDATRRAEGRRLHALLAGHLAQIESLVEAATATAAARPEALRERLRAQVAELIEAVPALPEERLAQEAALLIAKLDVREELDRLQAHVAAARELLFDTRPIGRRLDFLCQEFNREANTLCSKSWDLALTRVGLELKSAIDQLREQVQNVE